MPIIVLTLASEKMQAALSLFVNSEGGKSGQRRALCFLTGRYPKGYSSITENNRPGENRSKGEKVGQEPTGICGNIGSRMPHRL